jgi:methyl-accepting chemotaxis protein
VPSNGASAEGQVVADGRAVGSFIIAPADGRLLTPEEVQLKHELNNLHLVAGATSAAVALAVAVYLALSLARPLRKIRVAADRIAAGELEAQSARKATTRYALWDRR